MRAVWCVLLCAVASVSALNNGLGYGTILEANYAYMDRIHLGWCRRTPAMGYNTWYDFMCDNINAENIMKVADKMVELGLDLAGYKYI